MFDIPLDELAAYAFSGAAAAAAVWMCARLLKSGESAAANERGARVLPRCFRAVRALSDLLADSAGAACAAAFPGGARRKEEQIQASGFRLAGLQFTPAHAYSTQFAWAAGCAVFALAATALCMAFAPEGKVPAWAFLSFLPAAAAGWLWPSGVLAKLAETRRDSMLKELPFAVDLLGSAMKAGKDFAAALRYYVQIPGGGALKEEFSEVLQNVTLGEPFTESLKKMAARIRVPAFTALAGVVAYGAEIGAPIAGTLKQQGSELRRERFAAAERRAARAPVIMIVPLAVFIMPAVFIVAIGPVVMRFMQSF